MNMILIISTSILLTTQIEAKVICTEDCQGLSKEKSRQEDLSLKHQLKSTKDDEKSTSPPFKDDIKLRTKNAINRKITSDENTQTTNLPNYLTNLSSSSPESIFVVLPKTEAKKKLSGLSSGSILKLIIKQDIVASSNVSTPVMGIVADGLYKDSRVYGEAILDDELKRILFNFKTISGGSLSYDYSLKASGLDVLGRVGITGKYHADDISFGIASFFATATAIAADSQVERSKNIHGDYVDNPSAENAAKKGVAGAIGKVAERLSNRATNAPGRTEVEGPLFIQLILDESPFLKK